MQPKVIEITSTRMYAVRYRVNDHLIVGFTHHAAKQAKNRGLNLVDVINSLQSIPMALWKVKGVAAKKTGQFIKVFTVWRPHGRKIEIPF